MAEATEAVEVPASQWQIVDAVLSNSHRALFDEGYTDSDEPVRFLADVREATAAQIPWAADGDWPAQDHTLQLRLADSSWQRVRTVVQDYVTLLTRIDEPEEADTVRRCLDLLPAAH